MKVTTLYARDFCALQEIDMAIDGTVTVLSGDNGSGKTSVFRALMAALCGKRALPADPVRHGADDAEIRVTTDDGFEIHARIDADRGYRVDVRAGKMAVKSPAAWLAEQFGGLDGLAFLSQEPAAQAATIRQIAGVDTGPLDARRAEEYSLRRDIGRDVSRLRAAADEARPTQPAPECDAMAALADAERAERARAEAVAARAAADARVEAQEPARKRVLQLESWMEGAPSREATVDAIRERTAVVAEMEAQLELAKTRLQAAQDHLSALERSNAELDRLRPQLVPVELPDVPPPVDVVAAREAANLAAAHQRWARMDAEATAAEAAYAKRTAEIERIDGERAEMLAAAKFPVDGLGFGEAGLTLDGVPFAQASQAQRMRCALGVAMAREPRPPLLFVADAALLDTGSLAAVREMAAASGVHVMIERVADEPGSVRIEAGRVAS